MATASQIDEIRATLQKGLESLALSGNLKPLPLRQQVQRPVLRNQSLPAADHTRPEYLNGGFQRTLSNGNLNINNTRSKINGHPKRPLSAKGIARQERKGNHLTGPSTYSGAPLYHKPPLGKTKYSRPSSGRRTTRTSTVFKQSCAFDTKRIPSERSANAFSARKLPQPPPNIAKPVQENGLNKLKIKRVSTLPSSNHAIKAESPGEEELESDQEEECEEWSDIDENEHSGFDPLSERLPGDGASYDDLEEEDGLDGLNDEEDDDDESDGYSIASGQSFEPVGDSSSEKVKAIANERSILASRSGSSLFHLLTTGTDDAQPALSPSLFSNVPPTINFVADGQKVVQLPWELRKMLKWRMSPITPNVVKNCIARSGFRATKKVTEWIGYWGKHMKSGAFRNIKDYQKVNHIPGSFQIGRKDRLWKNLYKMQLHYGKKDYNFFPQTFVLPYDLKLLKRAWEDGSSKQKWILKPPASARGIGVRVIHKWSQIPRRKSVIVQKYLSKPYLINGSKFDLRIYVYLSCCDPLRLYIYNDGLARFATMKYSSSMKSLSNKFMHLTNYSINKKNADFTPNDSALACEGHKWGLKALWGYLKQKGIDTNAVWENIKDIVVKTIMCSDSQINSMVKANVRSRYSVHELFGFDIMLDENLKPWIIEVNISPSLHCNSPLDIEIKGGMIKDLMNMAGFHIPDKKDVFPSLVSSTQTAKTKDLHKDITMDKRMFTNHLSQDERAKHAFYTQKHLDEQCRMSVLDTLTPDDLRCLVAMEDEYSRSGCFERLFPSVASASYIRFLESPRYYNILLLEWVKKYQRQHARGLSLLEDFCAEKVHLGLCKDNSHVWTPVSSVLVVRDSRTSSAPSTSLSSPTHPSLKKSSSAHSLPKIRRRAAKGRSLSSSGSIASVTSSSSLHRPHPPTKPSSHSSGCSTPS